MRRFSTILATVLLCLAPIASWADLAPYSQDFEELVQADPAALANDGWLVFANVFTAGGGFVYNYGPFPAPNGGPAFSAIDVGQGDYPQGLQQLSVYSDYNNTDHGNGLVIEANVFQEQMIGAWDVGRTWVFEFDFARGNIEFDSTAFAFIKTIDPNAGYSLSNFITADMTDVPAMWGTSLLSIYIDPSLEGQILQFGFLSNATNYEGSGIFYDNLRFIDLIDHCPTDDDEDEDEDGDGQGGRMGDFPETMNTRGGLKTITAGESADTGDDHPRDDNPRSGAYRRRSR
jgi:hypothetical protein